MSTSRRQLSGFVLLEVLVTIVILVFGLLGLAGFQMRATAAENEAYQRVQALILAQDMVDRIYANRTAASTYVKEDIGTVPKGNCTDPALATVQQRDECEWNNALLGASETLVGASVGTLLGGRGCITAAGANEYVVTVVWQGLIPTVAPVGSACGINQYGNDALRRAISIRLVISTLSAGVL